MGKPSEAEPHGPVKAFLERLGNELESEVADVDVLGRREDTDPVIVELEVGFSSDRRRKRRLVVTARPR